MYLLPIFPSVATDSKPSSVDPRRLPSQDGKSGAEISHFSKYHLPSRTWTLYVEIRGGCHVSARPLVPLKADSGVEALAAGGASSGSCCLTCVSAAATVIFLSPPGQNSYYFSKLMLR